jgi:formylglycine-generating enzyme required for sulfatase activity
LDIWELRPGHSWQDILEEKIEEIHAAAVFVGKNGLGPWQKQELRAYLREFVNRNCPVIPVLLSDTPEKPQLPVFLKGLTWVDFRTSDPDPMDQLIWGITGNNPQLTNFSFSSLTSQSSPLPVPLSLQILTEILPGNIKLEMIKIPVGSFLMGSDDYDNEKPKHQVKLQEFCLGKYPVTQEQYQAIMGNNPSKFKDNPKNPVENVSWDNAQEFCQKLNEKIGKDFRLPTEAEWEYACRAGTQTRYYFGNDQTVLKEYAWYGDNSGDSFLDTLQMWFDELNWENYDKKLMDNNCKTHPVGDKKSNNWGLYDMSGNVWEWCEDPWHNSYADKPENIKNNGNTIWPSNNISLRVLRGGSWNTFPRYCRSASRTHDKNCNKSYGFRLAVSAF